MRLLSCFYHDHAIQLSFFALINTTLDSDNQKVIHFFVKCKIYFVEKRIGLQLVFFILSSAGF